MSNNRINKDAYYLEFDEEKFLAGKELLKSMPMLFNRVYFCKKYTNILWNGTDNSDVKFKNIALLANLDDMQSLRQIIKNNFLYKNDWDSIKYTDNQEDYGFSFIAGNLKYVIMPFDELEKGYEIRNYDVISGECTTTNFITDKKFFLDSSLNSNGEFVRTCAFNEEDVTDDNSKKMIPKKKKAAEVAVYNNSGFALSNASYIVAFMILVLVLVWVVYAFFKISQLA